MDKFENLDDDWIKKFETKDEVFKDFYKEDIYYTNIHIVYVNRNLEIENVKEETFILSVPNNITREEIIYLLKKNTTSNDKHYKIVSILKYNITLNPDQVTKYVNASTRETESYLEEINHIDSISFDKSICTFQDLTDIYFIFYEKLDKNKNNVTRKIVLNNKKKKGTRKDY